MLSSANHILIPLNLSYAGHRWLIGAGVAAACLAAVFPLTVLEMALLVLLPAGLGYLLTGGVVALLGMPAAGIHSGLMLPVMGVVLGYSLFLLRAEVAPFRGRLERPPTTRGSVLMGALAVVMGLGVLAYPGQLSQAADGVTALLALVSSMVAAMVLVPVGARLLLHRSACGGAPRLYHLLGGGWCLLYLLAIHAVLLAVALPVATLIHPRSRALRGRWLRRLARPGLAGLVHTFPYGKVVCTDVTRTLLARPAVIISNHQSIVDIPLLSRIPCDLRLTIKGQWWRHPLIGAGVKALNHVRVEPGDPDSVMRQCVQAFSEGSSIHFFPQGTRSPYGTPERFHKGAFELAIQVNADIQPLVLCDTWMCLPRGGIWVENFRMRMKALPRITPATFDYSLGAKALAKHAGEIMYAVWLEELELNNTPAILRRKVERLYRYLGLRAELGVFARLRRDPGLAALHGWVPRSGLILDLGCGYGPVSHWLAQAGPERKVLGIDRDADRIRVARCSACGSQQVTFEAQDFREGPLPECQAILLLDVLGEPAAKEDALLRKAFEALVPGGRLILRAAATLTGDYAGRLRELGFSVEAADGMACEGRAALVACKRPT